MQAEGQRSVRENQQSLREKIIQLGANENTASVLLCLHYHGASTSKGIQDYCNIRQPDVSMAITELREMNLVHFSPKNEASRGRPAHVYRLRMNLEQSVQPFVNLAKRRAKEIMDDIEVVNELVSSLDPVKIIGFTAA